MTIAELLIAGAIAGSSCCASMQVWGQAAQTACSARDLTEATAQLERDWLASRGWLAAAPRTEICALDAKALSEALEQSLTLASDLQRSLQASEDGLGLWLVLEHPVSGLERRQLMTASGLGGCADNAEPLNPEQLSAPTLELP